MDFTHCNAAVWSRSAAAEEAAASVVRNNAEFQVFVFILSGGNLFNVTGRGRLACGC